MNPIIVDKSTLMVVLIDLQPWFVNNQSSDVKSLMVRIQQLLLTCDTLQIPVLATLEEPIARKGYLIDCLATRLPGSGIVLPKLAYDLCEEPNIRKVLLQSNRKQFAVVGVETDVCVLQSVLGLLRRGLDVFLVEDCVMSSSKDTSAARARMFSCGAIPVTWKSLYHELLRTDDLDNRFQADVEPAKRFFAPPEEFPDGHGYSVEEL